METTNGSTLTGTCGVCGRENLRILRNGTLPRHKAGGGYGFCTGYLPAAGSMRKAGER